MHSADVITLVVLTPESAFLEKRVSKVSLPGTKGRFMVLKSHAPLISSLDEGYIVYESEGAEEKLFVLGGFVEILNDRITACVEV